jgi:hypothetical protein
MSSMTPMFSGGRNIAMKVPPHQWETTVDAIEPIDADSPSFWISSPAQVVHLVGPDRAGG